MIYGCLCGVHFHHEAQDNHAVPVPSVAQAGLVQSLHDILCAGDAPALCYVRHVDAVPDHPDYWCLMPRSLVDFQRS